MALLNLACASGAITTGAGTAGVVATVVTAFLPALLEADLFLSLVADDVADDDEDDDDTDDATLELLDVEDFDADATELAFELALLDATLGL